jgi:hypothetical protein
VQLHSLAFSAWLGLFLLRPVCTVVENDTWGVVVRWILAWMRRLSAASPPEDARQAEEAELARNAADSLRQSGRASINAAQASIRLGDNARAVQHARLAAEQPDTKERAEALLQALGKTL